MRLLSPSRVLVLTLAIAAQVFLAGPAMAFDPQTWASDNVPTCFQDNGMQGGPGWTSTRMTQANAAVATWMNSVPGLTFLHETNPASCSAILFVEMDWVTHLDGAYGSAPHSGSAPTRIVFAEQDGNGSAIPWSYDTTPESEQKDFQSTALHELGHALGLKHPEHDDTYLSKSWDGLIPIMESDFTALGSIEERDPRQDEISAGSWSVEREYIPLPGMADPKFWSVAGGTRQTVGPTHASAKQHQPPSLRPLSPLGSPPTPVPSGKPRQ